MSSPITDLMQQVHDHFLSLYQSKNTVVNQDTFLAFDSGVSPPISIESFRQLGQSEFSDTLATEEFSNLVNQVPQINANRFSPNGNQVEEQYEMLIQLGCINQGRTDDDQVAFGRMRDQAEMRLRNSKVGFVGKSVAISYCQSFATPRNWYRPDVPGNWTQYRISINQSTQVNEQSKPRKEAVKSAIALDLNQPWTLKVLPQSLTPVLSQPEILDRIAVQEVAPQIDRNLKNAAPIQFKRDDLLRSVADGNNALLKSLKQPKALQFDRAMLSQKMATFMPKELVSRTIDDRMMRIPKVSSNPILLEPIQAVVKPIATPIFDRSVLLGRNWQLQQLVNANILEQSQTETIKSSQISVSFDYCWVTIDRLWFFNPYLQMHNWYIPSFQSGELANAFPAMAIAVLLVRNLRIQSNWQSQELQSVQSSAALGPFSLVGRSIEQGTGALIQPGMQVMAWACQVMPTLPPSSAPV